MSNREMPTALPVVRNEYLELQRKSRRIPFWVPILCFASVGIGIPLSLALGAGALLLILRNQDRKRLNDFYQETVVPMCLRQVVGDHQMSRSLAVPQELVAASGLVQLGNASYNGDTYIAATYRGISMVMSNLTLKGRGDSRDEITFKGPFAAFYAGRKTSGNLWIFEKENKLTATGAAGQYLTGVAEFDRQYVVYADNPRAVEEVLDFRTMNAIMDAESKLPGCIRFSLVDGTVYMAVSDGTPLLSQAVPRGAKDPSDLDELIGKAMFEVCTLVDIADALCFS